ncbi:hypothetical protein R1sor_007966 [Riccia sorocarpa]|uniref:Uncharacterized protein n=1 Tax=Riccia sorocarpa TaxID=122646 RepID=A0ABD3HVL2_9MARC
MCGELRAADLKNVEHMGLLGMASDWASERLNAEGLLRFLADEYFEEDELRRSILRNWPESPHSGNAAPALKSGRFMPELFIRDDKDDSFRFLQSYIRSTVMELLQASKEHQRVRDDEKKVPQAERQTAYVHHRADGEDAVYQERVTDCGNEVEGPNPVNRGPTEVAEGHQHVGKGRHETGEEPAHLVYNGQTEVVEALGKMSDAGVIEAIPGLLDKMERKALLSIHAIVSGKTDNIRNRESLLHRVRTFFEKLPAEQRGNHPLPQTLQEVVKLLRSPETYKKVEAKKLVVDTSSPVAAAGTALSQVDILPLRDIHVIYQTLASRQAGEIGHLKAGGTKHKLKWRILKLFKKVEQRAGDKLPESLRKCLIVMSLSARHALGNDGSLLDVLGPIPAGKQSLHQSILSALSDVSYLKKENLLLLYKNLVPDSDPSKKTGVTSIRNKITTIFLDCLLNSEIRRVPKYVKNAASKLKVMMKDQLGGNSQPKRRKEDVKDQEKREQEEHEEVGRKRKRLTEKKDPKKRKRVKVEDATTKPKPPLEKNHLKRSIRLELEAVLRVSSHLQQIMYELSECSTDKAFPSADSNYTRKSGKNTIRVEGSPKPSSPSVAESGVAIVRSREVVEKSVHRSDHNTEALMRKRIQVWSVDEFSFDEEGAESSMEERESCKDGGLSLDEAKWMEDVTQVGDQAAAVAYMLVGCAVEKMSRLRGQKLETPLRDYLRSGVKRRPDDTEIEVDKACWDQDQVAFILDLAQNEPRISRRYP